MRKRIAFEYDRGAHMPRYKQLATTIKLAIIRGDFRSGEYLPTINELAEQSRSSFKVSRKALELLAAEGWTRPVLGHGSEVLERKDAESADGRILVYVRQTGYSYYCSCFLSVLETRLLSHGYKTYTVNASDRSETAACGRFSNLLKERWELVVLFGGGAEARRLAAKHGRPFMLVGDGSPLRRCNAPTCVGRVNFRVGKALLDFVAECESRGVRSVVQFQYDRGSFDAAKMLAASGISVETVVVRRKSTTEAVSQAAFAEMSRMIAAGRFPDLFLFTDDILAQGALIALSMSGVNVPGDVAVATHSNKGLGPIWPKPLSRLEVDPAANGRATANAIVGFLKTGNPPPDLDLGSVWKKGETM